MNWIPYAFIAFMVVAIAAGAWAISRATRASQHSPVDDPELDVRFEFVGEDRADGHAVTVTLVNSGTSSPKRLRLDSDSVVRFAILESPSPTDGAPGEPFSFTYSAHQGPIHSVALSWDGPGPRHQSITIPDPDAR